MASVTIARLWECTNKLLYFLETLLTVHELAMGKGMKKGDILHLIGPFRVSLQVQIPVKCTEFTLALSEPVRIPQCRCRARSRPPCRMGDG